jgi:hypothetical protein
MDQIEDLFRVSTLPNLAHTIQLALAPVFLLNGIAAILNMLTGRLSRIVDHARAIEAVFTPTGDPAHVRQVADLRRLDRRMWVVNNAIFTGTASAVVLCVVVAFMFLARLAGFGFARTLAAMFAVSLILLIVSLVLFLVEVRMAVQAIRIRDELLERR